MRIIKLPEGWLENGVPSKAPRRAVGTVDQVSGLPLRIPTPECAGLHHRLRMSIIGHSLLIAELFGTGRITMIRTSLFALASIALVASAPTLAAPCKDAKGKFVKCPPKAAAPAPVAGGVTKDAKGKCHVASGPKKGQFTKCP